MSQQVSALPTLSRALAFHFDYGARARGQTYFVQGRVQLRAGSAEAMPSVPSC
jgi:hypothetical protein